MNRLIIILSVIALSLPASAQLWSGILKPTSGVGACSFGQITSAGQCAIDWGSANVGLPSPGIPTTSTWTQSGVTISPIGGGTDDTSAINAALNGCAGTTNPGKYVQLSSGTFTIKGTLAIKGHCFLNGNGPQSTILSLLAANAKVEMGLFNDAIYANGSCTITSGNTAGSTSLTVSANGLDTNPCAGGPLVGGYLVISELNNTVYVQGTSPQNTGTPGCSFCDGVFNGARLREQIVRMTSVSGSGPYTIGITPALYTDYGIAAGTSPAYATPFGAVNGGPADCEYCGVQNLQIQSNGYNLPSGTPDLDMSICAFCFVQNVEFNYTDADWIDMEWNYRSELRNNYFFNSYGHGAGGSDADVSPRLETSASLIVNNIFERGHGSLIVDEGAAGNVIAYNYSTGNLDAVANGTTLLDYNQHAAFPQFNLWEANIGLNFNPDSWHGNNGYNTVFRNWFQGISSINSYPIQTMTGGTCSGGNCTINWTSGPSHFYAGTYLILNGTNQANCGQGTNSTPWTWAIFQLTGSAGSLSSTFTAGPCTTWTGGNAFTLDLTSVPTPIPHTGNGAMVATNSYLSYQALWPMAIPAFSVSNNFIGDILGSTSMNSVTGAGNLYNSGSGCSSCMQVPTTRQYTQNSAALVGAGTKATDSSWNYDVSGDSSGSIWTTFPGGPSNTNGYWSNQGYITGCYSSTYDSSSTTTINNIHCTPSTTLPPSFFLASQPSWWGTAFGTPPWPAIGPDVTGGPDSAVGNHANYNPAELCFNGLTRDATGAKQFDAGLTGCNYGGSSPSPTTAGSTIKGGVKILGGVVVK